VFQGTGGNRGLCLLLAFMNSYSLEVCGSMFLINVGEFCQTTCHHIPEGVFMVTAVTISYLRKATVSVFRCLLYIRHSSECEYTSWGMMACSLEDVS
jgi:hypothetical protein